jgi:hypothetical protein
VAARDLSQLGQGVLGLVWCRGLWWCGGDATTDDGAVGVGASTSVEAVASAGGATSLVADAYAIVGAVYRVVGAVDARVGRNAAVVAGAGAASEAGMGAAVTGVATCLRNRRVCHGDEGRHRWWSCRRSLW